MTKKPRQTKQTTENPVNKQQELANLEISNHITNSGVSQPHNAKKEALGPNTKR